MSKFIRHKKSGNYQNGEVLIYDMCTKPKNRLVERSPKLNGIKSHLKDTEIQLNLKEKKLNYNETSSLSLYSCGQFPKFHRCYTKRSVLDTEIRVWMLGTCRVFQDRKSCC